MTGHCDVVFGVTMSARSADLAGVESALAGLLERVELPADRPCPPVASHRGGLVKVAVGAELHQGLCELAHQGGASVFMVLQAGLTVLLNKLGAGEDIAVGSPIASRTDQALDDLVGFFVNTLVLRTNTSGDPSFAQLLAQVRQTALTETTKFDLDFSLWERHGVDGEPEGIDGVVEYATDLFDPATVETIVACWVHLLEAAVADPDYPAARIAFMLDDARPALLATHPDVAQAAITIREDRPEGNRLAAYVVVGGNGRVRNEQAEQDQLSEWQQHYGSLHATSNLTAFGHDFVGWNSSYDGQPIPVVQMREWREQTVARILSLQPWRVLEIGVGTGLLLSQLAPRCETYWATDFFAPAIDTLAGHVEQQPGLADRVVLRAQPAHDTDGLPTGLFDTVILNSVIQYFPSVEYLIEVLDRVLRLLTPGGAVFLGDVRNLRLLRLLATAVQLHRADASTEAATLHRAVERAVRVEKELLVAPEFFAVLGTRITDIGGVDIRMKRGRHHNELTRYRYDVTLYKQPIIPISLAYVPQLGWGRQISDLTALIDYLAGQHLDAVRVTGVPNKRIAHEAAAARALHAGHPLADLLDYPIDVSDAVDPETLYALGERCGYWVGVTWSGTASDAVDAVFAHPAQVASAVPVDLYLPASYLPASAVQTSLSSLTNNPDHRPS
jgi:SAM-dependent methyltransferase